MFFTVTDSMLEELGSFFELTKDQLLDYSIRKIFSLENEMKKKKAENEALQNEKDKEYARIVKKYLDMYPLLAKYWSEAEIICACSKYLSIRDIVSERPIKIENISGDFKTYQKKFGWEYIRTSKEHVPRYAKNPKGEQLLNGEYARCHVYRTKNQYQGIHMGDVVLKLLYDSYPELKEFEFSAYSCSGDLDKYEIYPKINIYTPLAALMSGDIETIKERNRKYAKSYNHGEWTPDACEKRLNSEEAAHFFDVIKNLKRKGE